jgi:ATP-dependent Lhr-like helicase
VHLAASDPANPYGMILPWPRNESEGDGSHSLARAAGASVVLINGQLTAFVRRRNPLIQVFVPENEPEKGQYARALAKKLAEIAIRRQGRRQGLLIEKINDTVARDHFVGRYLEEAGFTSTALGFQMRRISPAVAPEEAAPEDETEEDDVPETA